MTPKEKALVMYYMFAPNTPTNIDTKYCALIAVDEILSINKLQDIESQNYWQEVKQEIEKL